MSAALDLPFLEPPEWSCPSCDSPSGCLDGCETPPWPDPDDIPDEEVPW